MSVWVRDRQGTVPQNARSLKTEWSRTTINKSGPLGSEAHLAPGAVVERALAETLLTLIIGFERPLL